MSPFDFMSLMTRSESPKVFDCGFTSADHPCAPNALHDIKVPGSAGVSEASTDDDDQTKRWNLRASDSVLVFNVLSLSDIEGSQSISRVFQKLLRMLRTCRYADEDIISVLAVAACHHKRFIASLGKEVSSTERAFILLAQTYIAHCTVLDEYCCISNWHKYLFSTYCDLRALNAAVSRILKRMDWRLQVDGSEIESYINRLTTEAPSII